MRELKNKFKTCVSVVITTHNRLYLLQKAIKSVKSQTYQNIEIIVVDDASDDGTENYCKSIEGIKYMRIEPDESNGGNHARNIGIFASKGDYIAFLDDDDEWYPQKIEKQMELFADPAVGMVYCELYVDVGIEILNYKVAFSRRGNLYQKKEYWRPICTTSAMIFRKEVFVDIGGFDEKVQYWQEYELTLRVVPKYEVALVEEPLVRYRKGLKDKVKLTNNFARWEESVQYICNKHASLLGDLGVDGKNKFKEYYYSEAAYRAGAIGRKDLMVQFYSKAYDISKKIEFWIRWKFAISRQDTFYIEVIVKKILFLISKKNRHQNNS